MDKLADAFASWVARATVFLFEHAMYLQAGKPKTGPTYVEKVEKNRELFKAYTDGFNKGFAEGQKGKK